MPVNDTFVIDKVDFDQPALARPACTLSGIGQISSAMAGAQQPLTSGIKNAVGLPVQFHRHMGTAVQVAVGCTLEPDGKCAASLTRLNHIKSHGLAAFRQFT